jgi:uncharacterized protein DUF3859
VNAMSTIRMALAFVLSAVGAASGLAQTPQIQRIDIVEYGIYTVNETNCRRDDQGIERCDRSDVHHAATTWTIPAQHGVEFGLKYRVVGSPKGLGVALKRDWLLPDPGFLEPGKQPIKRIDRADKVAIGDTTYVSYGFDDPWELVPGPWILEIWYGGRKLTSQTFSVVKQ